MDYDTDTSERVVHAIINVQRQIHEQLGVYTDVLIDENSPFLIFTVQHTVNVICNLFFMELYTNPNQEYQFERKGA